MAQDSTAGPDQGLGQRVKHGVHSKVLVPVAAAIVSAAVSYLIKKLPMLLEEKVLPKLQESGAPERVTKTVEQASAAVGSGESEDEGEDGRSDDGQSDDRSSERSRDADSPTAAERAEQRKEREQRRRERKRATNQAA